MQHANRSAKMANWTLGDNAINLSLFDKIEMLQIQ